MVVLLVMKKYGKELRIGQVQLSLLNFLESYNQNMPKDFPLASVTLLKKFKDAQPALFKNGDLWSLDQHRKKLIDWLPRNNSAS